MSFNLVQELLNLYPQRRLQEIHKQIVTFELPTQTLSSIKHNILITQKQLFETYDEIHILKDNIENMLAQISIYKDKVTEENNQIVELQPNEYPQLNLFMHSLNDTYSYLIDKISTQDKLKQILLSTPEDTHTSQLKTIIQNFNNQQMQQFNSLKKERANILLNVEDIKKVTQQNSQSYKNLLSKHQQFNLIKSNITALKQQISYQENSIQLQCSQIEDLKNQQINMEQNIKTCQNQHIELAQKASILTQINNCGYQDDFEWVTPIKQEQNIEIQIEQRLMKLLM